MKIFVSTNWPGKKACGTLCGLVAALAVQAQPVNISTEAGFAGRGSSNTAAVSGLFFNPQGVAVDAAGNIYVADTANNVIKVITPSGQSSILAGTAGVSGSVDGTGPGALFNQPSGIALDAATNVYVTDYGNSTIREITPSGQVTTIAGSAGVTGSVNTIGTNALFFHPLGIAVDNATNLYVADYGNDLIRKITPSHVVTTLAGSAGVFGSANGTGTSAQFYNPEGVAVDQAGNVYVADTGNAAIRKITSGGAVTTLAGSPGYLGSTDATGTNALFYQPAAIAVTGASNLYVADYFNNTIRQVSPAGVVITLAGLAGTAGSIDGANSAARFLSPQGLAVSSTGTVCIADTGNSTLRAMTPAGVVTTVAGSSSVGGSNGAATSARFYSPGSLAVDGSTNVYVADTQNSVIRKINQAGAVSTFAGSMGVFGSAEGAGTTVQFSAPQGVAEDGSGNVYVADTGNCTIRKLTPAGASSTLAGSAGNPGNADGAGASAQFNEPEGVAVDGAGNVYVADTWNHTLRKITSGGVSSTLAGQAGVPGSFDGLGAAARFNCPTGVAVDSSGNIYVTDYNNETIREVTSSGVVTTLAGSAGTWGNADGTNNSARFFAPAGITVDNSGNLYVVDSGNDTLRKIIPFGANWIVTTVAGSPGLIGRNDGAGPAAQFYYPTGVAVNNAGYFFVADSGNNTIRTTKSVAAPTWAVPSPITYGTALTTNQLDATANVSGAFVYSPVLGTVLDAGSNELSVLFTPTDTTDYSGGSASVTLNVAQAPLTATGFNARRLYGTTNPVLSGSLVGVVNGDNITATYFTFAATNSQVGVYPVAPILVDPNNRRPNYAVNIIYGALVVYAQPGVFQNTATLADGSVQFSLTGTAGANYTLEVSSDLVTWTNLGTFPMTGGAVQYNDPTATNYSTRFYQLASP